MSEPIPDVVSEEPSDAGSDALDATAVPEPTEDRDSVFSPLTSVVEFWADNPDVADERARIGTLLINEQGSGQRIFTIPDVQEHESVMVVLICDSESNYDITISNDGSPDIASTSGGSCGGPMINSYTTSPLDPAEPDTVPELIDVDVPSGVNYYLTAYGVQGS